MNAILKKQLAGELNTDKKGRGRKFFTIIFTLFIAAAILLIGMIGGVWGFLILSNTDNQTIQNFRRSIGLADNPSIPSIQTLNIDENSAVIDAVKKVSPSVVSVVAKVDITDFFGFAVAQNESGGSGFIFSSDGYILTNKHVVESQKSVSVIMNDGTEYEGQVISTDPLFDLAVIKIEAKDLPVVELGNSDSLEIGQGVIAVGNAFGEFKNTVTVGVVSATNRNVSAVDSATSSGSQELSGLIQTDAAINPGNSGGPLVDLSGRVIGINTAIASVDGGNNGIGFAQPVNSFKGAVESVQKNGRIIRPGLGVRYIPVSKALAERNNLAVQYGALVAQGQNLGEVAVMPNSPAAKAGIQEGDILLSINGEDINLDNKLSRLVSQYQVGDTVEVKLLRNGKELTVKVLLEELK